MASIRDKGSYPCPRCLIPMKKLENMGTVLDIKQRKLLARFDDDLKQERVRKARQKIYEQDYAVDSEVVEALLKNQSLTPTAVSIQVHFLLNHHSSPI